MIDITIDTEDLLYGLNEFPKSLERELRREMKEQLTQIQRQARQIHRHSQRYSYGVNDSGDIKRKRVKRPYNLTGKLNQSITTKITNEIGSIVGEVGLDLETAYYGIYVHEGHGTQNRPAPGYYAWKPDKFLDAAIERREPEVREGFKEAINRAIAET
jgi:hypothetical protein